MTARVWDDVVVDKALTAFNVAAARYPSDSRQWFRAALTTAADAVEGAIRAEALAPFKALVEKWDSRTVMHGDVEVETVRSMAELAGSAAGLLRDLRAVLGDPDAAAKHNAAIWDEGWHAGYDEGEQSVTPKRHREYVNPYRTTEGTTQLAPPTQDDAQQKGTT